VTLSAGMATQGMVVFCNIYSTFLQRAYDQVIHDVALQNLPVIFCLDRAGLVGEDGATHHGVFDLAYLRCIPNMIIYAPKDEMELQNILYTASLGLKHPIAIRYPRGRGKNATWKFPSDFQKIEIGKSQKLRKGKKVAILSTGTIADNVTLALTDIEDTENHFAHYHFGFVKPLDEKKLHKICDKFSTIITVEDGITTGGFGSSVLEFAAKNDYVNEIFLCGIPDYFIEHGKVEELQQFCNIDVEGLRLLFAGLLEEEEEDND
jgi:1-deoxy-D-xylulose-5-phosphate synthase